MNAQFRNIDTLETTGHENTAQQWVELGADVERRELDVFHPAGVRPYPGAAGEWRPYEPDDGG